MADYFVDYNRGLDANAGTSSSAPWKNLTKIFGAGSLAAAAGDNIYLACDSEWNILLTGNTSYIPGDGTGWRGTEGSPVTLARYAPSSQSLSSTYPIIQFTRTFSSMTWSYNAGVGIWESTSTGTNMFCSKNSIVCLDLLDTSGDDFAHQAVSAAAAAANGQGWYYIDGAATATISLHSGSTTLSPADVWPDGFTAPDTRSVPYIYDNAAGVTAGTYLTIDSIKWRYCLGIAHAPTRTLGSMTGFIVKNCRSYKGRLVASSFVHGSNTATIHLLNNRLDDVVPTMGIHVVGRFAAAYVAGNVINGCHTRKGRAQGAIYVQSLGTYPCVSFIGNQGNDIGSEWGGGGVSGADGCFIYNESGASATYFSRNLAVRCTQAFQDNSGALSVWDQNKTYNCSSAFTLSDAATNGGADYTITGNMLLNCVPRYYFNHGTYSWTVGVINDYAYDITITATGNKITFNPDYAYDSKAIYLTPGAATKARIVTGNYIGPGALTDQPDVSTSGRAYDVHNMIYVRRVGAGGSVTGNSLL